MCYVACDLMMATDEVAADEMATDDGNG